MKNILKKLVIPLLARRPIATLGSMLFGSGVPIFVMHRFETNTYPDAIKTTPDHLRRCLDYLATRNYTFLSLEQLILALKEKQTLPPKTVVFTIDDGFYDQAEIAAPVFLEFGCPLTIFLITGMVDKIMWPWDAQISWITETSKKTSLETSIAGKSLNLNLEDKNYKRQAKRLIHNMIREIKIEHIPEIINRIARDAAVSIPEHPPESFLPMSWETARQLETKGIQFAPHTVTHNILSRMSKESMEIEICESWQTLKRELVNPVKIFCYPTGRTIDFGDREVKELKNNEFIGAVSTSPGFIDPKNNHEKQLFNLPRFSLPGSMNDFIQCCTWIEYAKNRYR